MGWLLGFGIVLQPLIALTLPLLLGATPRGQRLMVAARSVLISIVPIGIALIGNPSETYRSLVLQPTPPAINHATPWVYLAPRVTTGTSAASHSVACSWTGPRCLDGRHVSRARGRHGRRWPRSNDRYRDCSGHGHLRVAATPAATATAVAGIADAGIALLLRARHDPLLPCPPLFLSLVLASRQSGKRFWACLAVALEITVFAYHHLNPWVWWVPVVAGLIVILALTFPQLEGVGELEPTASIPKGSETDDSPDGGQPALAPSPRHPALF